MLLIIWTWKDEGVAQGKAPQYIVFFSLRSFLKTMKSKSLRRARQVGSVGERRNTHKIFIIRFLSCRNLVV